MPDQSKPNLAGRHLYQDLIAGSAAVAYHQTGRTHLFLPCIDFAVANSFKVAGPTEENLSLLCHSSSFV